MPFTPCGTRKTLRAYAIPRVFRPLRKKRTAFFCHRQRQYAFLLKGKAWGGRLIAAPTAEGEMRGCPSQSRRQADATAPPEGGAKSDGICGEGGECIYPHQCAAEQCSALRGPPFRQGGLRRGAKGDTSSVIRLATRS